MEISSKYLISAALDLVHSYILPSIEYLRLAASDKGPPGPSVHPANLLTRDASS